MRSVSTAMRSGPSYSRGVDDDTVLARVDAVFAGLAEGTPGWPVPRASDASPLDEEYSRYPDPAKYRVTRWPGGRRTRC